MNIKTRLRRIETVIDSKEKIFINSFADWVSWAYSEDTSKELVFSQAMKGFENAIQRQN